MLDFGLKEVEKSTVEKSTSAGSADFTGSFDSSTLNGSTSSIEIQQTQYRWA